MPESLGDLVVGLGADVRGLRADLRKADKNISGFAKGADKKTKKAASNMAGNIAAAFSGMAMLRVGKGIVMTAARFEKSMNRVSALSGATGKDFAALRGQALSLGKATVFSASQSADAMGFLAMAGFKTNEILSAMPGTLALAAAGQIEVAQAADIASNVLTGFGKDASEMTNVADVLALTFTSSNTSLTQLGEAFKFAGPVAKAAGVSFEETAAFLGLLGNAGIQASMAGTTMRQTMAKLLKPTKEGAEALEKFGVTTTDATGKLNPLNEIMEQMISSGADITDVLTIFGIRAGPGMAANLDQGSDKLLEFTKNLKSVGGTADRIATIQLKGLEGQITLLGSAWENYNIVLSDGIGGMTIAEAAVGTLTETLLWMAEGSWGASIAEQFDEIRTAYRGLIDEEGDLSVIAVNEEDIKSTREFHKALLGWIPGMETVLTKTGDFQDGVLRKIGVLETDSVSTFSGMYTNIDVVTQRGWDSISDTNQAGVNKNLAIMKQYANEVVGNSIIPDMVEGVGVWMSKLPALMIGPTNEAVQGSLKSFESFENLSRSGLGSLAGVETAGPAPVDPEMEKKSSFDIAQDEHEAQLERIRAAQQLNDMLTQLRISRLSGMEQESARVEEQHKREMDEFNAHKALLFDGAVEHQATWDEWQKEIDDVRQLRLDDIAAKEMAAAQKKNSDLEREEFEHGKRMVAQMSNYEGALINLLDASGKTKLGLLAGFSSSLLGELASTNKSAFEMNKGLAIADAIINAYAGISGVLGMFPGPVGWAMASVQAGMAFAQVSKIQSQSFSGGKSGGGGGGGGGFSGGGGGGVGASPPPPSIAAEVTPIAEQAPEERGGDAEFILDVRGLSDKYGNVADISKAVFTKYVEKQGMGHVKVTVIED